MYMNAELCAKLGLVRHKKRTEDLFACWCCLHDHSEARLSVCWLQDKMMPEHQEGCQKAESEAAHQCTDPNEWARQQSLLFHCATRR